MKVSHLMPMIGAILVMVGSSTLTLAGTQKTVQKVGESVAVAWGALQIGNDRANLLTSMEIEEEIATRILDDRTIEYLNQISPDRSTYLTFRRRLIQKTWEQGALTLASEMLWEQAGAELQLAVTRRELKDVLNDLRRIDQGRSPRDLRKILGFELKPSATDQEVLSFRAKQIQKRAWTRLRSAFALGVQSKILEKHSFHGSSPREIKFEYERLTQESKGRVLWEGYSSETETHSALNLKLKTLRSQLMGQALSKEAGKHTSSWRLPVGKAPIEGLKPLDSRHLPEELRAEIPTAEQIQAGQSRVFLVATPTRSQHARAELWIAKAASLPPLQEIHTALDEHLTRKRQQEVLDKHLKKTLSRTTALLTLAPGERPLMGDALFARMTGQGVSKQ